MIEVADTNQEAQGSPPYISFRTLLNLIERMADEDIPPRIDRSYLSGLSGGYQTQVMAALRSLGLINETGEVQTRLIDLVTRPHERTALVGAILQERYPEAVRLGEIKATQGQLEEEFKKTGITGATLRKAVAFYLHAATFAGIPVSPFFKTPTTSEAGTTLKRRRARTTKPQAPVPPFSTPAATNREALQTRYIEMLMKRVEEQEEIDERLLDRIEALLGYRATRTDEAEPED